MFILIALTLNYKQTITLTLSVMNESLMKCTWTDYIYVSAGSFHQYLDCKL